MKSLLGVFRGRTPGLWSQAGHEAIIYLYWSKMPELMVYEMKKLCCAQKLFLTSGKKGDIKISSVYPNSLLLPA
jgi:hypothetical protein